MPRPARLPGSVKYAQSYVDVDDARIVIDHVQLQRRILAALVNGPLAKWELREALHIPEHVIYKELKRMRFAGTVKCVGRKVVARKWALPSYQAPVVAKGETPKYPDEATVIREQKPKGPRESWWLTAESREAFMAKARDRFRVASAETGEVR